MSWSSLTRVAAPATTPMTIDAARAHLRLAAVADLAPGDAAEAADVAQLLEAAVGAIDGPTGIGIAMVTQTWRLSLDRLCSRIEIPLGPVQSISAITYVDAAGDTQTLAADQYRLDKDQSPAVLTPAHGVTYPSVRCQPGAVKITFVAGYGAAAAVPADLVGALKIILRGLFEDPAGDIPKGAARTLDRYRVGLVA
ncbi:hypothetical protein [Phenylobacterium sp.]|uniref:head-tail connector protein n=1 Tax=Phenylobacterium sp. TaxID=1871053 RepID=UPI002733F41E|nr:hypothetical protein [Phenylobacterium sp.]MDP3853623.1 hypothetical protein [Phenylobacterium sp.]